MFEQQEVSQRSDRELDCPVCFQSYTRHHRTPFFICGNGHSLCRECLTQLNIRHAHRKCPFCRGRIKATDILINTQLLSVVSDRRQLSHLHCHLGSINSQGRPEMSDQEEPPLDFQFQAQLGRNSDQEQQQRSRLFPIIFTFACYMVDLAYTLYAQNKLYSYRLSFLPWMLPVLCLLYAGVMTAACLFAWAAETARITAADFEKKLRGLSVVHVILLIGWMNAILSQLPKSKDEPQLYNMEMNLLTDLWAFWHIMACLVEAVRLAM